MIIGNDGEVIIFEVIDEHGEALPDMLGDDVADNEIGLARSGRTQNKQPTKKINEINMTGSLFSFQVIDCWKVYRVFIFDQSFFLRKSLVLAVKNIFIIQFCPDHAGKEVAAAQH